MKSSLFTSKTLVKTLHFTVKSLGSPVKKLVSPKTWPAFLKDFLRFYKEKEKYF